MLTKMFRMFITLTVGRDFRASCSRENSVAILGITRAADLKFNEWVALAFR